MEYRKLKTALLMCFNMPLRNLLHKLLAHLYSSRRTLIAGEVKPQLALHLAHRKENRKNQSGCSGTLDCEVMHPTPGLPGHP